jgi:hypothetical protein
MKKDKFFKDLQEVYKIVRNYHHNINLLYNDIDSSNDLIDDMLSSIGLESTKESRLAMTTRVVNLRSDSLKQVLKKYGLCDEDIEQKLETLYKEVSNFYIKQHRQLIDDIERKSLLTPFYREIFRGVHEVGEGFNIWQTKWTRHIIYTINKELYQLFNGDEEKIFLMLNQKNLYDMGHNGSIGDRSYSALIKDQEEFKSRAYCDLFYHEVKTIVDRLDKFIDRLSSLEDHTFDLKKEHINYLNSIKTALRESDTTRLIKRWADVDRAWMKITSPLQIGHPLEYYEDHYRKAVAPEWDLRIINPNSSAGDTIDDIKNMYNSIYMELKNVSRETKKTFDNSMKSLDQVQLYLGRPALFYGAELDGQFSAQVVPNDEVVSKECGKKIFAFADSILESARAKPFLKIHSKIFPSNFLHKSRLSLFGDQKKWHSIYNITTIGHEYGHILWIDDDSETIMNRGGNFKNIEEFKATTGGLVAFFLNDKDELIEDIIIDTVKRAVGLISWRETYEVQPYYCEGLIHLKGLFDSGVLSFNGSLEIDMSIKRYKQLKEWYIKTYKELATHYLLKEDATIFLNRYLIKKDQTFDPIDTNIKSFVDYYWRLYKDIGQVIDDKIDKNSYIK